jgi:hypothetical protein
MWPIYFLLAYYAATYLVVAGGVYVCFSVVAGHDSLGNRLFLAVLAFGACSLAGYIVADVLTVLLHARTYPISEPNRPLLIGAYVVPGMLGSWVSWKRFKPST